MRGRVIALVAGWLALGLASAGQAQTCEERHATERQLILTIQEGAAKNVQAATTAALNAHDALKTAGCLTLPPQKVKSPDGTFVPNNASQLIDAGLDVWTLGPAQNVCDPAHPERCRPVLKNGSQVSMTYGAGLRMCGGLFYLIGDDGAYYKQDPAGWNGFVWFGPNPPVAAGCTSSTGGGQGGQARAVIADHDGLETPPYVLAFRLYIDGVRHVELSRAQAWSNGHVVLPINGVLAPGTRLLQVTAVYLCPAGATCPDAERESPRSLPPLEIEAT